ncbi:mediator of RNA polymerase II transcription subunit 15 isoform X3 [Folsomia candida]|uniref:mediator of RNA polymerase II transcription subunit 15 isoform X3 n=1 Tax=Folsomia candida TaxID=158441 RepID=UPI001604D694|nr:mediator of RNA polymerase II transcription subunit 15 isoform X3 [Folsomia candida]
MAGMVQVDDGSWRTPNFRQNMVTKIEEAIQHCGAPTNKNAAEMENQVYSKATTRNEYLSFVARLILHIKEMGNKAKPPGAQLNQLGGGGMNVLHNQINQLNTMGGGGGMNPGGVPRQQMVPGMGGQQAGMQQPQGGGMTMPQQVGGMGGGGINQQGGMMGQSGPGGMMGQQQQVRIMAPGLTGGVAVLGQQGGGMMVSQAGGPGGMNVNMTQQGQQQNPQQMQQLAQQQTQQGHMINPNFMNQHQLQQQMQSGIAQGQMQGNQGGMHNQQMQQQQLQNAQMQQAYQQQQGDQHRPAGVGRGMRMQTLQQMQNMPRKTLQQQRPMNPAAIGISLPEHGTNYPMNGLIYFNPQVDSVGAGMPNQFQGGQQIRPGGPLLPPSSGGMPGGPSPSPNSMIQGQNQPGFANSPQPPHPQGSPAPPQNVGIRPLGNQMIPSPIMNVSTPMPTVPMQSPRNDEELACMKKIEELRRYTDMIQRMIIKIGLDDAEKSSKMKKLLDILMNPVRQVSMDILLKCEAALKKMEKQHDTGPPSQPSMPPKDHISPFFQIQEAILTTMRNGSANHTFLRSFRPTIEALTGQSVVNPDIPDEESMTEEEQKPEIPMVLQRELKMLGRRFPVKIKHRGRKLPIQLNASLGDPKLPRVPPLKIIVPIGYPEESPVLIDFKNDYSATSFLNSIAESFKSRKVLLPTMFTVYELLISWEMSVRQVANPLAKRKPLKRLPNPTPLTGRLGLSFL